MRLANASSSPRRSSMLSSITGGRFGRARATTRAFPAEAERLVTQAELRRLHT
ncbi:hypothetical protein ACPXCG_16755 [Gordonia sp. DT218]|uniref:hypothetical protein n=1 Tax=Gordonia sp. DT218 TaxID=3416659 RepID=UPI003CF258EF